MKSPKKHMNVSRRALVSVLLLSANAVWSFQPYPPPTTCALPSFQQLQQPQRSKKKNTRIYQSSSDDGTENQALEALQSLADFHEGQWHGHARSFTVSADTAAGILQRRTRVPYTATVKLGMDLVNREYTLTETLSWQDGNKVSARTIPLQKSNTDVDTVDASFSFDTTLPNLPSALIGTDQLPQFLIEHCVAVNDNERARCLVLYGVDQALMRVVLCHEHRSTDSKTTAPQSANDNTEDEKLTAADLLEMQNDVDRLVSKITGDEKKEESKNTNVSAELDRIRALDNASVALPADSQSSNSSPALVRHGATLLELTSGVWLGDLILRDKPNIPMSLEVRGRGFGKRSSKGDAISSNNIGEEGFAKWSIGVQKAAWRWMWGFQEEIRQITDFGKGLGAEYAGSAEALPGEVCVNEGLSRRMEKSERMVYIDWGGGKSVSFLADSFSVQVPRYLTFSDDSNGSGRPFYTEFGVYQQGPGEDIGPDPSLGGPSLSAQEELEREDKDFDVGALPEVVCSKIGRVYNFEGLLKQGCTSFFTLKRFGGDDDA